MQMIRMQDLVLFCHTNYKLNPISRKGGPLMKSINLIIEKARHWVDWVRNLDRKLKVAILFSIVSVVIILILSSCINSYFFRKQKDSWFHDSQVQSMRPWGASSFCVNTQYLAKHDIEWANLFLIQSRNINEKLQAEFGLTPRIFFKNSHCPKDSAKVNVMAAPKSRYKFGKREAHCQPQLSGYDNTGVYAYLYPYIVTSENKTLQFNIEVCVDKYKDSTSVRGSSIAYALMRFGKDGIAKHELYHLFFHKHVNHNGGIMSSHPTIKYLGPGAINIFRDKILPEFEKQGLTHRGSN